MRIFVRGRICDEVPEKSAVQLLARAGDVAASVGWEGRLSFWVADGPLSRGRPGRSACQKLVSKYPELTPCLLAEQQLDRTVGGHWHLSNFSRDHFPAANPDAPQLDIDRLKLVLQGLGSMDAWLAFVLHDVGAGVGAVVGRGPGVYERGDKVATWEWLASSMAVETAAVGSDGRALLSLVATFELSDELAGRVASRAQVASWLRNVLPDDVSLREISVHARPSEAELDSSAFVHSVAYRSIRATFVDSMAECEAACRAAPPIDVRRERWLKLAAQAFEQRGLEVLRLSSRQVEARLPIAAGEVGVAVAWFGEDDVRLTWSASSRLRDIVVGPTISAAKGFLDPAKGFLRPAEVAARTFDLADRVGPLLLEAGGPRPTWVEQRWWKPPG